MLLGFLFILNHLFICLFVCSFLHFFGYFLKRVTIQIWDQTCQKLLPAVEVTSKHGNKPINSCHMFIIVYSSFIILNGFFLLLYFCIYYFWIYVFIILNLCIYYFQFMYLIYAFILFELRLLFLNSCIYSIHVFIIIEFMYIFNSLFLIHVFIISEYMYLLFLTIKLFLCFYLLLFQDISFAISILWLNDIHI